MKIGIVLPSIPKYSETFLNSLIQVLQKEGVEVIVFSGEKPKEKIQYKCVPAYQIYSAKSVLQFFKSVFITIVTFLKMPLKTIKLFQYERSDHKSFLSSIKSIYLNAHILPYKLDWLHFGFATMTLKRENIAKVIGAKMSVSLRGYDINILPLKHKNCYSGMWNKVDKVHTISDYLRTKSFALGLNESTPFERIAPAVDTVLWQKKETKGQIKNPVRIFTSGRLNWIKDFETAISAMEKLNEKGICFTYSIAGEGREHERLRYAVHQSGLDDKVFFLGRLSHNDIYSMMMNSDIYLQTSLQEGFCVSVLEAQAAGLICIVSDADGLRENVIDKITGYVIPRRSPDLFAEKIIEVINMSDEERYRMIEKAVQRVQIDFNITDQQKKFSKFFTNER